jgi:hypothetical protein
MRKGTRRRAGNAASSPDRARRPIRFGTRAPCSCAPEHQAAREGRAHSLREVRTQERGCERPPRSGEWVRRRAKEGGRSRPRSPRAATACAPGRRHKAPPGSRSPSPRAGPQATSSQRLASILHPFTVPLHTSAIRARNPPRRPFVRGTIHLRPFVPPFVPLHRQSRRRHQGGEMEIGMG